MRQFNFVLFSILVLVLAACASNQHPSAPNRSGAPMHTDASHRSDPKASAIGEAIPPETQGSLTLSEAWSLTVLRNPQFAASELANSISKSRALQTGRPQNPELSVDFENVAGSGAYSGSDLQETTLGISQLIEWGGKRRKRSNIANLETQLGEWDQEALRLELLLEVARRTISVVKAQESEELAIELTDLARRMKASVEKRIEAGFLSPVEHDRQLVEFELARVEKEKAQSRLRIERHRLAAMWNSLEPRFERVEGLIDAFATIPSFQAVADSIESNPEIARWATETALARARLQAARAEAVPDTSLGVGARRYGETGDHAFVFSISLPLPLLDRNQHEIYASRLELDQVEWRKMAVAVAVRTSLLQAYETLVSNQNEALAIRDGALPAAERAYFAIREGFERGQFDYIEALDAQRSFFQVKSRYIEASAAALAAAAEVEALIGQPLARIINSKSYP